MVIIIFNGKGMLKITAVIPAYNEANRIVSTLYHTWPIVDEIVVVDDARQDATAELAKNFGRHSIYPNQ